MNIKNKILEIIDEIGIENVRYNDFSSMRNHIKIYKEQTGIKNSMELIYSLVFEKEIPICEVCKETSRFISLQLGYSKTCSMECTRKTDEYRNKLSSSLLNSESAKEQRKERAKKGQKALQETINSFSIDKRRDYFHNQQNKRVESFLQNLGVDNPMKNEIISNENHKLMKQTNIDTGRWLNYSKIKSDYLHYCKRVDNITKIQDWQSLKNSDKRAHISIEGSFHLDHKYSKKQGFIDNIPPFIIGNIKNLEMKKGKQNLSKQEKCSITKEKLLTEFYN